MAALSVAGNAVAVENASGTADRPAVGSATATGDRWAVVNGNGTFARGKGVAQVSRGETPAGSYIVRFNRDVTSCMYQATIGLADIKGVSAPGEITVVRRYNDANAVYVTTSNSSGVRTDLGFHLYVGCK